MTSEVYINAAKRRQEILDLLNANGEMSQTQIALALGMGHRSNLNGRMETLIEMHEIERLEKPIRYRAKAITTASASARASKGGAHRGPQIVREPGRVTHRISDTLPPNRTSGQSVRNYPRAVSSIGWI